MLESHGLLLLSWAVSKPPPTRDYDQTRDVPSRTVRDLATGLFRGRIYWRPGTQHRWLQWFACPMLEIYETEDESLLCTAQRSWGILPRWQVRDADENLVGWIVRPCFWVTSPSHSATQSRGTLLLDRLSRKLAVFDPGPSDQAEGRFLDAERQELATLAPSNEGLAVTFAVELDDRPFEKMLLLAAALCRESPP